MSKLTLSKNGQRLFDIARKRINARPFALLTSEHGNRFPRPVNGKEIFVMGRKGGDIITLLAEGRKASHPTEDARVHLALHFNMHVNYIDQLWQGWDYGVKTEEEFNAALKSLSGDARDGFKDGYIMYKRMSAKFNITRVSPKGKEFKPLAQTLFAI